MNINSNCLSCVGMCWIWLTKFNRVGVEVFSIYITQTQGNILIPMQAYFSFMVTLWHCSIFFNIRWIRTGIKIFCCTISFVYRRFRGAYVKLIVFIKCLSIFTLG